MQGSAALRSYRFHWHSHFWSTMKTGSGAGEVHCRCSLQKIDFMHYLLSWILCNLGFFKADCSLLSHFWFWRVDRLIPCVPHVFLRNCCFCCRLQWLPDKSCVTRNYTIKTLCWFCCLFFSHQSAAPMIKGSKWRPSIIASLVTQNSNLPHMTAHWLPHSSTLRYCGGLSDANMAAPQDICLTSFQLGDPPPQQTQSHNTL